MHDFHKPVKVIYPIRIEINVVSNTKITSQITPAKEAKKIQPVASKSKVKNYVPQTRVSVVGSNNIPIILMNQQSGQIQPAMTNFKTFYNWNANTDYNYNIDVEGKNGHR